MSNWTLFTKLHRAIYTRTGGRLGSKLMGMHMLLLTTTGRKSGLPRTLPLACFPDGDDLVVVGSNNGQAQHPAWFMNLQQDPEARIHFGRDERRVRAEVATGEERARLWTWLVDQNSMYAKYEKRTTREIPVVVLRPSAKA